MTQYQSFPDAAGASRSLDKLKALRLPALAGKSFLDVGCNEGFFCGYAAYAGAARSVGLDQSALFIGRAREHFPHCEFIQASWDRLPEGAFDVILLASALHYADDQSALVHALVDRLAPDGVLVLELGIASSKEAEWVRVKRGIDERLFPSMPMLKEMLKSYAWKWMGPSVRQDGDPINRHVLHISRARPMAYLLMQPPAHGKTSIARELFVPAGVPVLSGDELVCSLAAGKLEASSELRALLANVFSPYRLDVVIQHIFDEGFGPELVRRWVADADGGTFALDMYVPQSHHAWIEHALDEAGYLPVTLQWRRVGACLPTEEQIEGQADAFYLSLVDGGQSEIASKTTDAPWRARGCGFVDEVNIADERMEIRGWAVASDGSLPDKIGVRLPGRTVTTGKFEKCLRPDVQAHFKLPHALLGYRISLNVPGVGGLADVRREFEVFNPAGDAFSLSQQVEQGLARGR